MTSTSNRQKSQKGTVRIKASHERLQLVFTFAGHRHYLSLGLPDTALNRKIAEAKAKLIESDIAFDRFDQSLDKYKPQSALSTTTAEVIPIKTQPSLSDLWDSFMDFKRPQCSPNTMRYMYLTFTNYVAQLPTHDLNRAPEIRDYVLANIPLNSGKRLITRFSACCQWAIQSKLISENPFAGMAAEIKLPKKSKIAGFNDLNPFSLEERDAIIQAIKTDQFCPKKSAYTHSCYAPIITLLFSTGCRPSEASALQWKNISKDCGKITFDQTVVVTENGRRIRKGLKTQTSRVFPCNNSLRNLLLSIHPESPSFRVISF